MRAYRLTEGGGIDGITMVDEPAPTPGLGHVLVRVRATSLNYRDLGMVRNPRQTAIVPLSDGAGEVAAVGEGVTRFKIGDRVIGSFFPHWEDGPVTPEHTRIALGGGPTNGMLAEHVVLAEGSLVRTPAHLTDVEASALPCAALTAWHSMFEAGGLIPGETVLLLGTGGVSIAGLQFAHMAGVRTIITSSSDEKLGTALELGADETVNYRTDPDWEKAVLALTDGRGVDLVLEVGGEGTFAKSMAATRIGGRMALIGGLARDVEAAAHMPMLGRNVTANRMAVGSRAMFERMNRAIEHGVLHPVVDRVFGFNVAQDAYRYLESQQHIGKIVITIA